MNKKVSVFCLWRDSEKTIYKTLKQLENLESIEGFEFSYFFYENDSKDNTVKIIEEWLLNRS
jgi:Fe2+ or Zn2+ uptake regulation protein